ncbi:protein jag [Tumebacillus sp. ITR2]|uniref:RNA-binding protein KhpB n=1 Tax=Tumebacillus amylolyticus TaxID=2801339 RepID=A0ABS1J4A8_9BACL|nr:protein jag [Tumebacillus amylolyticus]
MKKVITTGKTVELATELALNKLGVSRDRVNVTILTQPNRGLFFGLFGKRDAEVEVEVLEVAAEVVVPKETPVSTSQSTSAAPLAPDPILETRKFLDEVLAAMNLSDIAVTVEEEQDYNYCFRLRGESIGMLIGRRGATLDSLQYLVNLVANKHSEKFLRVSLDAEDYRSRRKETLERLADRLAKKAVQSRREVVLEPMGNAERKVIHSYLQGRSDVKTHSQGDEPYRKVVITPRGVTPSHHNKPRHPRKSESGAPKKNGPRRQGSGNNKSPKSTKRPDREPSPKA